MKMVVHCRCNVERTIETSMLGPWRLRCKACREIIWDPKDEPTPAIEEATSFEKRLLESAELGLLSSSGHDEEAPRCSEHPKDAVVAACSRCGKLLCARCLDRVGDIFTCRVCLEHALAQPKKKGLTKFLKRVFGEEDAK